MDPRSASVPRPRSLSRPTQLPMAWEPTQRRRTSLPLPSQARGTATARKGGGTRRPALRQRAHRRGRPSPCFEHEGCGNHAHHGSGRLGRETGPGSGPTLAYSCPSPRAAAQLLCFPSPAPVVSSSLHEARRVAPNIACVSRAAPSASPIPRH